MELTHEQIEDLLLYATLHEQGTRNMPTLFMGHEWTPHGAYITFYQPMTRRSYGSAYTWDRLSKVAGEYGLEEVRTFLLIYRRFIYRGDGAK